GPDPTPIGGPALPRDPRSRARRPPADDADIEMHEVAARVVSDPAAAEAARHPIESALIVVGSADIDGHALRMEAVAGSVHARAPQQPIGLGRPVAADHLERPAGIGPSLHALDDVEEARIDRRDGASALIAHELIDARKRLRDVAAL